MPWHYSVFAQDDEGFPDKNLLDISAQTTVTQAEKIAEEMLSGHPVNYVICGWYTEEDDG
jgi:hypothetical protein